MGRILAIDYGKKRTGLAVTDPQKIVASGLDAIPTQQVHAFLKKYIEKESVERIIVGMPTGHDGKDTDATALCRHFIESLQKQFPNIPVSEIDESFTSRMARQSIAMSGAGKKKRENKFNTDKVSATIILQSYMEQNAH